MVASTLAAPTAPRPELADIVRRYAHRLGPLISFQERALQAIADCRTPALGGRLHACEHCGDVFPLYNSCRNRHCPKCQTLKQLRWLEDRKADLLPVQYFHLTFTFPQVLNPFFLHHPRVAYSLLFRAVAETLHQVAANPTRLGAKLGFTLVLHSWGQTLNYHPHIHGIVTGGGLSPDGSRWISCQPGFFLPKAVLRVVFRATLLRLLQQALEAGTIHAPDGDGPGRLKRASQQRFVVDIRPPFGSPEHVLRYLANYTQRIAISNHRLLRLDAGRLSFRYRDRARHNRKRTMTLSAVEFLRRFARHILPPGFVRLRHYGLLANATRATALARCRQLLAAPTPAAASSSDEPWLPFLVRLTGNDPTRCPSCRQGHLIHVLDLPRMPGPRWTVRGRATCLRPTAVPPEPVATQPG